MITTSGDVTVAVAMSVGACRCYVVCVCAWLILLYAGLPLGWMDSPVLCLQGESR